MKNRVLFGSRVIFIMVCFICYASCYNQKSIEKINTCNFLTIFIWILSFSGAYVMSNVVHEYAHLFFFHRARVKIIKIHIALITVLCASKKIVSENKSIFSAYCTFSLKNNSHILKIRIGYWAGGCSCLFFAIILMSIMYGLNVDCLLIDIQIIAFLCNFLINTVNPISYDRCMERKFKNGVY